MKNVLLQEAMKLNKERKRRKVWQKIASTLAAVVVFCTTYALILPAITMESDPVCGLEAHTHGDGCYEQQMLYDLQCTLETAEGVLVLHSHSDVCYDMQGMLRCQVPEVPEHIHTETCFETRTVTCTMEEGDYHTHSEYCSKTEQVQLCTMEERQAHNHEENCYDSEGNLLCQLPVAVVHDYAQCLVENGESVQVMICQLPEHTHVDGCYPVKIEEDGSVSEYLCGSGEHTHGENCVDAEGNLTCTIPEHSHEAACLVADLDLTADMETQQQWEATMTDLEFSGNWAEDVLTVAKSQLGYQESQRNCVLVDGDLKGYTRYGQWYGAPYADWDDMFVSFCLEYAEISVEYMPRNSSTALWIQALKERELYTDIGEGTPAIGDLVFLNTDEDEDAEFTGIAAELLNENEIRLIGGNTENGTVDYITLELTDEAIVGYAALPENPMSEEQWGQAEAVNEMLAELPEAETVRTTLETLNEEGDKAAYEALRQEVCSRTEAVRAAYDALDESQQARVGSLDRLTALEELCGSSWQDLPALTDDSAVISELTAAVSDVVSNPENETEVTEATGTEYIVKNGDTIRYYFTATAESYYSDLSFGEATAKVELVLPLGEEKARFDTDSMTWLEDSELTIETRNDVASQVLTGYKRMTGNETSAVAVPGSFTEMISVEILDMAHGETVQLTISVAMEHSTWEGQCETHGTEEKITIQTQPYTLDAPLPEEERSETFAEFHAEIEELTAEEISAEEKNAKANELLDQVVEAYYEGLLSAAELELLGDALRDPLGYYAEYATGISWMLETGSESSSEAAPMMRSFTISRSVPVEQTQALSIETYSTVFPSSVQVDEQGGGHSSTDGAVYVSKTIEGTDAENVFDITLQVITKDEVNEVYKEPDMAVVVVMDISNTMNSNIGTTSTSRYAAAMDAGADFLTKFAENTSGLSKVGYVAFNTHAHEIFDLSSCGDAEEAAALAAEMRSDTRPIIKASGYASSANRFTNIEAGLKMAYDMLDGATNQHKYIIFISDGFPTTYLKSGYTGYNPTSSSGTKDTNGVFYDDALNKWCKYGTSYSDTAAIRAREMAVSLKAKGVNIFSIGVDVSGQSLSKYHAQSYNATSDKFSTVERREEASYYSENGYEIGIDHDILKTSTPSAAQVAIEAEYFKNWLKGTATSGIGSGYYYDSTDTSGLKTAYEQIFEKIKEMNAASSHLDWVAADPMGDMGVHDVDAVDFIGFYDRTGNLVPDQGALVGSSADSAENTADFHADDNTIHWNLKQSGYYSVQFENTTQYMCYLKYRVRLKNEESAFVENQIYDTNDVTTLTYRIIEVKNGVTSISERREIDFPIPAVHGYLSELNFKKVDPTGAPLPGAEFTLSHDPVACAACTTPGMTCSGEGVAAVTIADQVATSDHTGMVTFTEIPSGHIYTLTETKVPDGYIATKNTYQVQITYDNKTVTVLDADGNPLEWTETIENDMYYELPNTGGMGTSHFTFGGVLMISAGLVYICITGRKRRKEGR